MARYSSPWRVKSKVISPLMTAAEVTKAAGLDYTVEKREIYTRNVKDVDIQGLVYDYPTIKNHFATVRTDTNAVLGIVGNTYSPLQNVAAFDFFDTVVGKGEAVYDSAGTLNGGAMAWIMAKLPGFMRVGKDDLVDKMLLFTTTHDGSRGAETQFMPHRGVCANTLSITMLQAKVSIRHTTNAEERLRNANDIMGISHKLFDEMEIIFNKMHRRPFLSADLIQYVHTLVPDNVLAKDNIRTENIRERIFELVEVGAGASMANGTAWGAYNAVTEYVDHFQNAKAEAGKALKSMWFGAGSKLKQKAFSLALKMSN